VAKNDWWVKLDISDWQTDERLKMCSFATRGFWLEAILIMTKSGEFSLSGTVAQFSRLFGISTEEVENYIEELDESGTADVIRCNGGVTDRNAKVTERNEKITLISRRLKRELSSKENNKLRQAKFRNNAKVTEESRDRVISNKLIVKSKEKEEEKSSVEYEDTTSKKTKATTATTKPKLSDDDWLESMRSTQAYKHIDIDSELQKAQIWCDANNRQRTRKFMVNWFNRIQAPIQNNGAKQNGANQSKPQTGNGQTFGGGLTESDIAGWGIRIPEVPVQ
jgi:hypothetical protein